MVGAASVAGAIGAAGAGTDPNASASCTAGSAAGRTRWATGTHLVRVSSVVDAASAFLLAVCITAKLSSIAAARHRNLPVLLKCKSCGQVGSE